MFAGFKDFGTIGKIGKIGKIGIQQTNQSLFLHNVMKLGPAKTHIYHRDGIFEGMATNWALDNHVSENRPSAHTKSFRQYTEKTQPCWTSWLLKCFFFISIFVAFFLLFPKIYSMTTFLINKL